jgi:hypothetical protein
LRQLRGPAFSAAAKRDPKTDWHFR